MSDTTKIEWAHSTFNPWIGCTKVSPGCLNCYAEKETFTRAQRAQGRELWGKGQPRWRTSAALWAKPHRWNEQEGGIRRAICPKCGWRDSYLDVCPTPDCLTLGSEMAKERLRVFPSMCDWLDDEVPLEWLRDFLKLIQSTPNLDWLLLTKRPENFWPRVRAVAAAWESSCEIARTWAVLGVAPRNVWFGFSAENSDLLWRRWGHAKLIPACVTFISLEPLLGDIEGTLGTVICEAHTLRRTLWPIFGGESGRDARLCNVDWIRAGASRCRESGVPCFVKQLGARPYFDAKTPPLAGPIDLELKHPKGGNWSEWPEDLRVRQFPAL